MHALGLYAQRDRVNIVGMAKPTTKAPKSKATAGESASVETPIPDAVIVTERLADLRPHPRNYREHPPEQLAHLKASIKNNGVYRPIVLSSDGVILAGHGLAMACAELGIERVPTVRLPFDSEDRRALLVVAGDNEVSLLGGVNDAALTELLRSITADAPSIDDALLGTGFDSVQLNNYFAVTAPPDMLRDTNAIAKEHWVGMPEFKRENNNVSLSINFDSEESRQKFMDEHGFKPLRKFGNVWSMRWPVNEYRDLESLRVVGGPKGDKGHE